MRIDGAFVVAVASSAALWCRKPEEILLKTKEEEKKEFYYNRKIHIVLPQIASRADEASSAAKELLGVTLSECFRPSVRPK